MSHEIRIVRGDQMPPEEKPLPRAAATPTKVHVRKTEGTGVEIHWADGAASAWTFPFLRNACPCATCQGEREQTGRTPGDAKPKKQDPFALYEAPARPLTVTPVGRYALQFEWNDGHTSGIYSWEYLRRLDQPRIEALVAAEASAPREHM